MFLKINKFFKQTKSWKLIWRLNFSTFFMIILNNESIFPKLNYLYSFISIYLYNSSLNSIFICQIVYWYWELVVTYEKISSIKFFLSLLMVSNSNKLVTKKIFYVTYFVRKYWYNEKIVVNILLLTSRRFELTNTQKSHCAYNCVMTFISVKSHFLDYNH